MAIEATWRTKGFSDTMVSEAPAIINAMRVMRDDCFTMVHFKSDCKGFVRSINGNAITISIWKDDDTKY